MAVNQTGIKLIFRFDGIKSHGNFGDTPEKPWKVGCVRPKSCTS